METGTLKPPGDLLNVLSPSSHQMTAASAALQGTSGAEGLSFDRNKKTWICQLRQEKGKRNERGKEKAGSEGSVVMGKV